jgi:hypothetical protein
LFASARSEGALFRNAPADREFLLAQTAVSAHSGRYRFTFISASINHGFHGFDRGKIFKYSLKTAVFHGRL